jgi:histone deacetylase HOS3
MNSLHSANGVGPPQPSLRRSSSGQLLSGSPPIQEKPPLTAAGVASDYFKAEFEAHHGPVSTLPTQSVVILNDAVYGHRFSRPRTSRNHLSLIVERPERIKANVLGISMAYVRLGGRHSEGAVPPHPKRQPHDVTSIPFRVHKTERRLPITSQAVTNVHGTKWMEDLKYMCDSAEAKLAKGEKELQRPGRVRGGSEANQPKLHEGDLYLCSESLNAIEGALGAVCEGIDAVFSPGPSPRRAFVGVRPPGHHCSAGDPSGFCWVNNVHVGIMHAALNHGLTHAAIIDFDLHHGDGSQAITWQHNSRAALATKNAAPWKKTSIGYFSLHDINSYPCEGGDEDKVKNASLCIDNAHGQSIWNVHLQPWKTEQEFWALYESKYCVLLEKTRAYLQNQAERLRAANQPPKAAIFLSAGFDASEWESSGMQRHKVNVPTEFYARLSHDVVKLAAEEGLYTDGRIISVLEGGYSDRALFSSTLSHLSGLIGQTSQTNIWDEPAGLGAEMSQRIGTIAEAVEGMREAESFSEPPYQPSWWASEELDRIESLMSTPAETPKKPRQSGPSTFSSPTQASTAKVVDPVKMRRSLSGLSSSQRALSRPASPPPPEVPWTIAAHELSKILIPSHRQTDSCTAEDLNAEATRARQARQSVLTGVTPATTPERTSSRMALRGRKPKAPVQSDGDDVAKGRRRTVASSTASSDRVSITFYAQ